MSTSNINSVNMKTRILRDSNYSFLITKEGFSRRIQSGTIEYANCQNEFNSNHADIRVGTSVLIYTSWI